MNEIEQKHSDVFKLLYKKYQPLIDGGMIAHFDSDIYQKHEKSQVLVVCNTPLDFMLKSLIERDCKPFPVIYHVMP